MQNINFLNSKDVNIELESHVFTLKNGLTLVIHPNLNASVIAVNMTYKVGSKDEPFDKTGIAHFCEHLMFGGTSIIPGSFLETMLNIGAVDVNGVTNKDRTNFHETVLPGALDFALFAEADRMSFFGENLTSDLLERQRSVVINEKDERDGEPLGAINERRSLATFPAHHPYAHTVIGEKNHLEKITLQDMREWFKTYYVPSNAILTLAGCVNVNDIYQKVTFYFGNIPTGRPLPRPAIDYQPISIGKYEVLEARAANSSIHLTWNIPSYGNECTTQLSILATLLSDGNEAYLHKRIVVEKKLASQVNAYVDSGTLCSQFTIAAVATQGVSLITLEASLLDIIEEIKAEGVHEKSLEKVRASYISDFTWGRENMTGIADLLAWHTFSNGHPKAYKKIYDTLFSINGETFRKLVTQWLTEHRYTMHVVPFSASTTLCNSVENRKVPKISHSQKFKHKSSQSSILSNGIKFSQIQLSSLPGTLIRIVIPLGTAHDAPDTEGITALTCRLLLSESETEGSIQELQRIGASFIIESKLCSTVITLKTLSASFSRAFKIFLDHLLFCTIPFHEFERKKTKSIQDIASQLTSHNGIVQFLLHRFAFPEDHSYCSYNSGKGTPKTLNNITFEQVIKHRNLLMQTEGIKILAISDMDLDHIKSSIDLYIPEWVILSQKPRIYTRERLDKILPGRALIIDKPGSSQTTIVASNLIPGFDEKFHASYNILTGIFSTGFNSRLNMRLREELNWTYGVQGFTTSDPGSRIHVIKTTVQRDKALDTIREIKKSFEELLHSNPITSEELDKRLVSESLRLSAAASNSAHLIGNLTFVKENNLAENYWSNYCQVMERLNIEELRRLATEFFNLAEVKWIIVGDIQNMESDFRSAISEDSIFLHAQDII
ncbi:M16 family metallopeptidase [Pseudomonas orientalis]|uniref:M16 family metallopeptidase n=1 Tax=Pseudomonas orientalis TaxID=76758 RepID=UPI0034D4411D